MNITPEQKEYIESIIKECPGYKGNESLLDEFCDEVIRRAYSLVSEQKDINSVKVYLKRIANSAILEVIKSSINSSGLNKNGNQTSENINYEFDENGDIALNYDISFEKSTPEEICLTEAQINLMKEVICKLDENNDSSFYTNIFRLRYLNGLNSAEIAERLGIKEAEADKKLLFMLRNFRKKVIPEQRPEKSFLGFKL